MHHKPIRYSLFGVAVCLVLAAYYFELPGYITIEKLQSYKQVLGWWAPVVFVVAFVIGELLQVPSVLWIFFAGVIWPWWFALPLALVAALFAATGAFIVARYFLGNHIHEKLPDGLQKLDHKLKARPISAVIVLRLTTFLHPAMHWVLAASSIRLPQFLLGTLAGIVPLTMVIVLLGDAFMSWWDQYSIAMMATVFVCFVLYILNQRRKRALQEQSNVE